MRDRGEPIDPDGAGPLITLVLHKFSRGGSDRVAAYLAKGFVEAGFRVELLVFAKGGEVEKILLDLVGDVPVHFIRRASRWRTFDLLAGFPAFVRHLRKSCPQVVLSTANNTALVSAIGCWAARVSQSRLVLKTTNPIASSRHRGLIRRLRLWTYRLAFRRTGAVWTLSDDESAEMREEFPEFAGLFQSVDQPYVTPAMKQLSAVRFQSPGPLILSVARLTKQKRLDLLIRAFAKVRTDGARLLILGEGEDRASLQRLAAQLGVSARISMPGYLADIAFALKKADVFVLTSDYEGLPAAVIEAMAANCPVLSTNCFPSASSLLSAAPDCELISDPAPHVLAKQIDETLARARPTELSATADKYSIDKGLQSHVCALHRLLGRIENSARADVTRKGAI